MAVLAELVHELRADQAGAADDDDLHAVSVPQREYEFAGRLLLTAIEEAGRTGEPVAETLLRVAADTGRELGAGAGSLEAVLEEHGFEPGPDGAFDGCTFLSMTELTVYGRPAAGQDVRAVTAGRR